MLVQFVATFAWKTGDRKELMLKRRSDQQGSSEFLENLPEFYRFIMARYRRVHLVA